MYIGLSRYSEEHFNSHNHLQVLTSAMSTSAHHCQNKEMAQISNKFGIVRERYVGRL